jgi:Ca-activated chloride channel family protein
MPDFVVARFVRSISSTMGPPEEDTVKRIASACCVLALWIAFGGISPAQTEGPSFVEPEEATCGQLFRISGGGAVPLPITGVAVDLRVSGVVVDGTLTQSFENSTGETIETLYVFPLPEDAAVYAMEMRIGDRRIVAEVHEKEKAQRIYTEAKEDGRKAALVSQHRPNLFRTSATNILPGETIEVELHFVQKATREGNGYRLRFPLAIMPRFVPAGHDGLPRSNVRGRPDALLTVELDGAAALDAIDTPFHSMKRTLHDGRIRLEPTSGTVVTDRDFILKWKPSRAPLPQVVSFVENHGDERYALILVTPPTARSPLGEGLPTETLFVVDVSGSMRGPSIEQAQQALTRALDRLRPDDRFNMLRFNGEKAAFAGGFEAATPASLKRAKNWVAALEATGGTAIEPALARALDLVGQGSSGYASRVIFVTDGAVANEQEVLRAIAGRLGNTRLHTIGIGAAPNAYLMRKMAWHGRGICEFVASTRSAKNRIDSFFNRLERPVWTSLELAWEGVDVEGVAPARLPDLHQNEPLVLAAKLSGSRGGSLTVGGWSTDGWTERTVSFDGNEVDNTGITLTWARAQVESLMDSLHEGADAENVRQRVVEFGMAFNLVTAYTSLVAVEQYVGELSDGLAPTGRTLPRTGTLNPLKKVLASLLALAGLLGLLGLRRTA